MRETVRGNWYRKSGYYYVRISYYVDGGRKSKNFPTGIKIDPHKKRKQEKEADKKVAEIVAGFKIPGSVEERREQMFADTVAEWLELQKASKPQSTYAGYQYAANDVMLYFDKLAPVRTVELTSGMLERYQAWERTRRQPGYTGAYKRRPKYEDGSGIENTIKHRMTLIRSVLQSAKQDGLVGRNVASSKESRISLPTPQHNVFPVLNAQEASHMMMLMEEEELWFRAAVALGLLLGLRRSETIGATESALNWDGGRIVITQTVTQQTVGGRNQITVKPFTKNKRPKDLPLIPSVSKIIEELIKENQRNAAHFGRDYDHAWDGYLIRYTDGKLVHPNALTNKFAAFIKKHMLKPIRYHDLRHSCASILYANGVDLITIQEILGHAQISTTYLYTHMINDQQNDALVQMSGQIMKNYDKKIEE